MRLRITCSQFRSAALCLLSPQAQNLHRACIRPRRSPISIMVHYADVGGDADENTRFDTRGGHAMGYDGEDERAIFTGMVQDLPETAPMQDGLDQTGIRHLTLAELTLHKVRTSDGVRSLVPAASYVTAAAWTRWSSTQNEAHGGQE